MCRKRAEHGWGVKKTGPELRQRQSGDTLDREGPRVPTVGLQIPALPLTS